MKSYPCSCDEVCTCIPTGCNGITGPTGPQGATGPQGEQGNRGPTGPQGPRGVAGPQGPQGVEGPRGPQGMVGREGPQGEQGATGPEGMRGPTGPAGIQGIQGVQGPTGPQGIPGNTGVQGPTGATGGIMVQQFAGYTVVGRLFQDATRIPLTPYINQSDGAITAIDAGTLQLQPGVYDITYGVSGLLSTPGTILITPYYNDAPHPEQGAYDNSKANNANVQANRRFLLIAERPTILFLQFNSSSRLTEGEAHLTIIKLITSEDRQ